MPTTKTGCDAFRLPAADSRIGLALCSATSARRSTLPAIVFGSDSLNSTCAGLLYGASFCLQYARSSSTVGFVPARFTTHAFTTSPFTSSGTPATPTS